MCFREEFEAQKDECCVYLVVIGKVERALIKSRSGVQHIGTSKNSKLSCLIFTSSFFVLQRFIL